MKASKSSMRALPSNSTNMFQPCDIFVIQNLEKRWISQWDFKKAELLHSPEWLQEKDAVRFPNPEKMYLVQLVERVVRDF